MQAGIPTLHSRRTLFESEYSDLEMCPQSTQVAVTYQWSGNEGS